jgi:hypothetical protein
LFQARPGALAETTDHIYSIIKLGVGQALSNGRNRLSEAKKSSSLLNPIRKCGKAVALCCALHSKDGKNNARLKEQVRYNLSSMNRRSFIGKVSQGALGISASNCLLGERNVSGADAKLRAKNWMWTNGSEKLKPDEQKQRFQKIREAGIDAVLFSGFNAEVLACAKEQGLETHAWTWTLCRGDKELLRETSGLVCRQ